MVMKYIKPYEVHNESWRKTKAYLQIPALVVDYALSKLLNYVPRLNSLYKSMAAKIDTGTSFNSGPGTQLNDPFEEIKLEDIKDEKIRKSLKISGLFSDWHIYKIDRLSHDGKTPIYISKDVLRQGDAIHGQRLPGDTKTYYNYDKDEEGYHDDKGRWVNQAEFYVVAAKHTEEHEEMSRERRSSYEKKEYNRYKSMVNKAVDKGYFFSRTSMGDFTPLFHTLVKKNYLDLVKKCLESSGMSVRTLIVRKFNSDGDRSNSAFPTMSHGSKNALELSSAFPEMRKLLVTSLKEEWQKNKN
jgi:hypothetical protein